MPRKYAKIFACNLLEEEVIVDELLSLGVREGLEGVELAGEVTLELVASLNNLAHDVVTLLVGDAGAERELSEVTANSDTGGLDEGSLFLSEGRAVELVSLHVGDVAGSGGVAVVVLHDLVEEVAEGGVGVGGAGVAANTGVGVLAAGEDAHLEGDTGGVLLVVVLVPDVLGQVLAHEGGGTIGELRPALEVLRSLEVGAAHGATSFGGGLSDTLGGVTAHCKVV